MNQTDLARRLSATWGLPFHQQTIQRIENGKRPVRLNEAILIARELGVRLETMTESEPASARAVMQAVDEARSEAGQFADHLTEDLGELAVRTAPLIALVDDMLRHYKPGEPVDPVLKYGYAWANRFWDVYANAYESLSRALNITHGRDDHGLMPLFPEFEAMDGWFSQYDELFDGIEEFPIVPPRGEDNGAEA